MGNYGTSLVNKAAVTTMATSDHFLVKVGGLLRWITASNASAVLTTLITGSQKLAVRTVSASSVAATASDRIINCDASSNAINVNMPASSDLYDSAALTTVVMEINRIAGSANNVTITPNGSETIDGASSKVISSGGKKVYSDGSNLFTK